MSAFAKDAVLRREDIRSLVNVSVVDELLSNSQRSTAIRKRWKGNRDH